MDALRRYSRLTILRQFDSGLLPTSNTCSGDGLKPGSCPGCVARDRRKEGTRAGLTSRVAGAATKLITALKRKQLEKNNMVLGHYPKVAFNNLLL